MLSINLTEQELIMILRVLGEKPFNDVAPIINNIRIQAERAHKAALEASLEAS